MFFLHSDVVLELPFKLSHPKPPEETPPPTPSTQPASGGQVAAGKPAFTLLS